MKYILIAVIIIASYLSACNGIYNASECDTVLKEGFGIINSSVVINNAYPGWSNDIPLTIVNGKDKNRVLNITLQRPSDCIIIKHSCINIEAGQVLDIPVHIIIPANMKPGNYEYLIQVEEYNNYLVNIALVSRWYITIID